MAKTPKKSPKNKASAEPLSAQFVFENLQIKHVRLVELTTSVSLTGGKFPDHAKITAQTGMGPTPDGTHLNVDLILDIEAKPKEETDGCSVLLIKAKYQCVFSLEKFTFESLTHLGGPICDVGMRVAWPYVRELVQSISSKMSIPAIVMPLLVQPPTSVAKP